VTITLTDETVWLTRHDARGAPAATYPVSAGDVASAFSDFGASTGLLPADTLFWHSERGQLRIGVWLLPCARRIIFENGRRAEHLTVPLPGLVFAGQGMQYWIFAAPERPANERAPLYHAPLSNVYPSGLICAGNVRFPKCTPGAIGQAVALFFESHFNHDLGEGKVKRAGGLLKFLRAIQRETSFPVEELQPAHVTVSDLMAVELEKARLDERDDEDEDDVWGEEDNVAFDDDVWVNEP
jgi:PRTRC genetic system protein B